MTKKKQKLKKKEQRRKAKVQKSTASLRTEKVEIVWFANCFYDFHQQQCIFAKTISQTYFKPRLHERL